MEHDPPLDGSPITSAEYFDYVNAHGGVYGRRIIYRYLDDHGDIAYVPSLVHQLVQQDAAFAIVGGYGTEANLAAARYLAAAGVPDLLAESGCSCLSAIGTVSWQPGDTREAKILGAYLARRYPRARIGILYQHDQDGQEGVRGLSAEIPARRIVSRQPYPPASRSVAAQIAALKAAGAQIVVAFTTPAVTAMLQPAMTVLRYHPLLAAPSTAGPQTPGVITDSYLPAASAPTGTPAATWITLFRGIWRGRLPGVPFTPAVIAGMAAAYTFTQAMFQAGPNPTRQAVLTAFSTGLPQGPAAAPYTSTAGQPGISGAYVALTGTGGTLTPLTGTYTTSGSLVGPVTADPAPEPPALATGMPPR